MCVKRWENKQTTTDCYNIVYTILTYFKRAAFGNKIIEIKYAWNNALFTFTRGFGAKWIIFILFRRRRRRRCYRQTLNGHALTIWILKMCDIMNFNGKNTVFTLNSEKKNKKILLASILNTKFFYYIKKKNIEDRVSKERMAYAFFFKY